MGLEMIFNLITELKETSSLNEKRAILRREKDNELFQLVLTKALDPRITFGIKKIPEYEIGELYYSLEQAIEEIYKLENREATGNDAISLLKFILESISENDAQVIKWIISKDFKAGFGVSLVNDEMKPFSIYTVPYMGASSYNEKRVTKIFEKENSYAFSEVKMDGRYLNVIVKGERVHLESRGGKPNPLMGALENEAFDFRNEVGYDVVINGELMFKGEKDRYIANGIIASFISIAQKLHDGKDIRKESLKFEKEFGMSLNEAKQRISLVVWDFIPYSDYLKKVCNTPRYERLEVLEDIIQKTNSFELIEYEVVNSKKEALEHFQKMLARGEEGTILKSFDGVWKDGKPSFQVKVKLEIDLDFRIVGFNYGTKGTKNEHVISSIDVESECGLLKTSPGGIKEKEMEFITENQEELMGKLVEIKCSGLSRDSEGNWSCLHPVFKRIRDDKEIGDTLEKAIEIENAAKGL